VMKTLPYDFPCFTKLFRFVFVNLSLPHHFIPQPRPPFTPCKPGTFVVKKSLVMKRSSPMRRSSFSPLYRFFSCKAPSSPVPFVAHFLAQGPLPRTKRVRGCWSKSVLFLLAIFSPLRFALWSTHLTLLSPRRVFPPPKTGPVRDFWIFSLPRIGHRWVIGSSGTALSFFSF